MSARLPRHARQLSTRTGRWSSRLAVVATAAGCLTAVPLVVTGSSTASAAPLPSPLTEIQPNLSTKFGGRAVAVSVNPSNRAVAFVASESGGLFKTTDTGAHWSHVESLAPFRLVTVAYAPGAPSVVIAVARSDGSVTNQGGVWRSSNGGATWSRVAGTAATCGSGKDSWSLAFAPSTNDAFVGDDCGLLVSHDLGQTWTRRQPGGGAGAVPSYSVAAQPDGSGGSIVDVCSNAGHYRSTASGDSTWSGPHAMAGGTCSAYGGHGISASPFGTGVLFAALRAPAGGTSCGFPAPQTDNNSQLVESDDGGNTWQVVDVPKAWCAGRQPWLGVHASGNNVAGDVDVFFGSGLNAYKITCSGTTGSRCSGALTGPLSAGHSDQTGIDFDPTSNCPMYMVSDGGIHSTSDCGTSWPMQAGPSDGYNALQLYEAAGQTHPDHTDLYIGTQDNSFYASGDNGATWSGPVLNEGFFIQAAHSTPDHNSQVVTVVAPGPANPNFSTGAHFASPAAWVNPPAPASATGPGGNPFLLKTGVFGQFEASTAATGGTSLWKTTAAPPTGPSSWTRVVLSGPAALVSSNGDLLVGLSGRPQISGPPGDLTIIQPYARTATTTGLLRISGVSGTAASVTDISGTLGSLDAFCDGEGTFVCPTVFGVDPSDPLHIVAPDSVAGTLRVTRNGGQSWTNDTALTSLVTSAASLTFSGQTHVVSFDPVDGNRIAVGTEKSGILLSLDGGQSWSRVIGSQRVTAITSFFWDENRNDLIVGTYGRGLWKMAVPLADLQLSVSHHPEPVLAGEQLFYDVTVTNNGPDPAAGSGFTADLPSELSYVTTTLNPSVGTCSALGQRVSCLFGDLANGDTVSFTLKTAVKPDAIATSGPRGITTTFRTSSAGSADSNGDDNVVEESSIVDDAADVQVTRVCVPDLTVYADTPVDCTVYVDNSGPSYARGVALDETLLSEGTFSVSNVSPAGCSTSTVTGGRKISCAFGAVPAATTSSAGRVALSYRITAAERQQIDATSRVRSDTPDPVDANNLAHDTVTINATADLAASASAPATATPGQTITWTASVLNNGPSTAQNVTLSDALPAGATVQTVTAPGGTCVAGVPGDPARPLVCTFGSLASGASKSLSITAALAPQLQGTLHTDVRAASDTFDRNSSNDLAHTNTSLVPSADLAVAITATPSSAVAGTPLSYRITVTNNGPSTSRHVVLTDPLPAALVVTSTSPSGGSCGLAVNTNTVTCQLPDLDPGATATVFVYVNVKPDTAAGTLTNVVSVTGDGDGNALNNSASVDTPVATRADMAVTLTSDKATYKPSTVIHYTISISNLGPSDAQGVVVRFQLPPAKSGSYVSNDAGCPAPSGGILTCSYGLVPYGGTRTFQVNWQAQGNKGTITTVATVSTTTTDPVSTNNSATRNVTVK